ncbi:MAG: phosphate acyltransferase PlsX, partial [Oscillospiraceae bacterium]|nr:phosphate acyltransferase PlsX [Oscillospiraceae bacterium]
MRVLVDAMGGDNAPLEILKGTLEAKAEYGITPIFVGDEQIIKKVAAENALDLTDCEIVHTPEIIAMDETPSEIVKSKKNSSMGLAMQMLADGKGDALVSAGNSGALVVGATLVCKRIKGIKRPAFAPVLPNMGGCFMLIDSGANIETRPEMMLQFGLMGSVYMEKVMGVAKPRVALANVGTEEHKGGELQQNSYKLLQNSGLNFIGNIEGRDIPANACDVLVCDGFTGNLILKTYEGVAMELMNKLKSVFMSGIKGKIAAGLVYGELKKMKKEFDYNEYGGAPVLGTAKPVFKSHGSAKAKTFKNAIRLAKQYYEG